MNERPRSLRQRVRPAVMILFAVFCQNPADADENEIVFGLIPTLSPYAMVRQFHPLALYLSRKTGIPVTLRGAPDLETFMTRVLEGSHYDMIIADADFFRLAERRAGYRAIVRVEGSGTRAFVIASSGGGYASIDDLPPDIRIASTGVLSIVHRMGSRSLRGQKIIPGENAKMVPTPSHNASVLSVLSDHADIAIIPEPLYINANFELKERIAVLERSGSVPHYPIAVHPDMPPELVALLIATVSTLGDTPQGQAVLDATGYPGFVAAEPGLYENMDWAADEIETLLGVAKD